MLTTLFAAAFSFVSTNIDDIFVLMLFFAQEEQPKKKRQIVLGQYLGIGVLAAISIVGAGLLQLIPRHFIGFLGFVPIALGVKEWISYLQEKKSGTADTDEAAGDESFRQEKKTAGGSLALSVMLISIANGADNLGVYIPLFAGYSAGQLLLVLLVFSVMAAVWCLLAQRIASLPVLRKAIRRYRHIIVPVVFVALGVFILAENFL